MARTVTIPVAAPPDTLRVDVAFYDEDEQAAFEKVLPSDILKDIPGEMVIPTPDFCTYYLYYKLREGVRGYGSHNEVADKWQFALGELDGQIEFADGTIRLTHAEGTNRGTSERFGEAIGLSVASQLHNIHGGDWNRIPETNTRKIFDFNGLIASDGQQFVQLEAKGSSVEDNQRKPSTVSNHKRSIKAKKSEATPAERTESVLYGTIGVIDDRPVSTARCWLVDPPADAFGDPQRFRLLSRLEYIAHYISYLGQRSQLAAALQTRLAALHAAKEYTDLDGIALRTGNDEEFTTETFDQAGKHNPWFGSKSVVTDGPAGGHVYAANDEVLLFIGIREQLVAYAAPQDFDQILKYTFPAGVMEKTVQCVVSRARFKRDFALYVGLQREEIEASAGYFRFLLSGHLYYCQSGLVFGVLPIPEAWRTTS